MGNSPQKGQAQQVVETQEQIMDQNLANQIVLTAFSTLESIKYQLQFNKGIKADDKKYGYYDKVDYSQKSLQDLKKQLVLHVESFRSSKKTFKHKHQKKYTLPKGFNEGNFKEECKSYKKFFKQQKQMDLVSIVEDMEKIYEDSFTKLSIDDEKKWNFESENYNSNGYKEGLVRKGVQAANEVEKERNLMKARNITDVNDIPVQVRR